MAKQNGSSPLTDNQLARLVADSASQVWHVGRGAYSRAGAGGSRLFGGLMNFGGRLDREAKSRVFEARSSATEVWDRFEAALAQRVARALNSLQIPTARDVHELNRRVAELQKAVVSLERRAAEAAAAEPKPRRRRAPATRKRRAATKKTAPAARTARKKTGG